MIIMSYTCPSCKSENIQKSTMTHVSGISKTKGVGIGVGMSGGPLGGLGAGIGVGKATNQTMLSQMTTAPKISSPIVHALTTWILLLIASILFFFAIGIGIAVVLDSTNMGEIPVSIVRVLFGLSVIIVIVFSFWGAYKAYRKHDLKNKETMTAYDEQYICLRCGNVFRITQP
jgi:ABC-type sugar transport system permease subunit